MQATEAEELVARLAGEIDSAVRDEPSEPGHDSDFEVKAKKRKLAAAEEDSPEKIGLRLKANVCIKLYIAHTGVAGPRLPQEPPIPRRKTR